MTKSVRDIQYESKHLRLGVGRALCLDKVGHHDGEAHAHIEVVLHDEVFLDGANFEEWKSLK